MLLVARLFLACDTSVVLSLSRDRDIDTDYLDMCIVKNGEFDELKASPNPNPTETRRINVAMGLGAHPLKRCKETILSYATNNSRTVLQRSKMQTH